MADKKPRILQNNKDMAWSLIPLILGCLLIAAVAGQCSLRVGGPEAGEVPRIDLAATLQVDADAVPFPIRQPAVPEGWIPNSASQPEIRGASVAGSTVGFVTDAGTFLSFTQTDAPEQELALDRARGARLEAPTGAETVGDVDWVVYDEENSEPVWVADLGETRVAITGSGSPDEFVTLAEAVGDAPIVEAS